MLKPINQCPTRYIEDVGNMRYSMSSLYRLDGSLTYFEDLELDLDSHIRYLSFFESPNNNALERKWSNFHVRVKPFRCFKLDLGHMAFI